MVLYSIIDIADVLYKNNYSEKTNVRKVDGGFVELQGNVAASGKEKVKRFWSTNPALYLDKRYFPY